MGCPELGDLEVGGMGVGGEGLEVQCVCSWEL